MIILWKGSACLAEFLESREKGLLERSERPKFCGDCQKSDCYWAHGSYARRVEEGPERADISIPRWKCRWCGHTYSELPYFVVPRRRYAVRVLAAGVQRYASSRTTYRDEVSLLGETGPSPAQLFRWVELLGGRAKGVLLDLQNLYVCAGLEAETLIEREREICPNTERAKKPGKAEQLNALAKAISFGRGLFQSAEGWILERLGRNFPDGSREAWSLFEYQANGKPTPHKMKPAVSGGF
jgi:hypothetical protein